MYNKVTAEDIKALSEIVGKQSIVVGQDINPDYSHDELGDVERLPEVLVRVCTAILNLKTS